MWSSLLAFNTTNFIGVIKIKQAILKQTDGKRFWGGRCCFYSADFNSDNQLFITTAKKYMNIYLF